MKKLICIIAAFALSLPLVSCMGSPMATDAALLQASRILYSASSDELYEEAGFKNPDLNNVYLGNPIPEYNLKDGVPRFYGVYAYPVYSNGEMCGLVGGQATLTNNIVIHSLSYGAPQELINFLKEHDRVAIVYVDCGPTYYCTPDMCMRYDNMPLDSEVSSIASEAPNDFDRTWIYYSLPGEPRKVPVFDPESVGVLGY